MTSRSKPKVLGGSSLKPPTNPQGYNLKGGDTMKKSDKYAVRVNFNTGLYYDYYRRTLHDCMVLIEGFKKTAGADVTSFNMVYCGNPATIK